MRVKGQLFLREEFRLIHVEEIRGMKKKITVRTPQ